MSGINIGPIIDHAQSFATLNDAIALEAGATLLSIEEHLKNGYTKKEIVDEFNQAFQVNKYKFKSFKELDNWLRNVGI